MKTAKKQVFAFAVIMAAVIAAHTRTCRPKTIRINGSFDQWRDVKPEFTDEPGDAFCTSQTAQFSATLLRATNDIVLAKVAAGKKRMYFYVKTDGDIVATNDSTLWLTLLVNSDCNYQTGWNGYDFMATPGAKGRMLLKRYAGGKWTDVKALKWKRGEKEIDGGSAVRTFEHARLWGHGFQMD